MTPAALPPSLPPAFSYTHARQAGVSDRALRNLRDRGLIEPLSRGLYLRSDTPPQDTDLLQIAARAPEATLCLRSALARHQLIDEIPAEIDLALPRGRRTPSTTAPVRWHRFARDSYDVGRETINLAPGLTVGIYTAERCIVDAFRLRHQEGPELAHEALKAWLRQRGTHPARLMATAASFPRAQAALRAALEILL